MLGEYVISRLREISKDSPFVSSGDCRRGRSFSF
jgi:hypothetical protein